MDIQNDTEIEVEFQVQGGSRGGTLKRRTGVRLELGKSRKSFTVTFTADTPEGKRTLAKVYDVERDQGVHLGYCAQVVQEHVELESRRRRRRGSRDEADD